MFKFLHCADIHLDSPQRNLERYDGAPVEMFRSATRRAFDNLVELAISEEVKFVIVAGDLYDGDCRDFSTPLHLRKQFSRLASSGIRVFICQGNHDARSRSLARAFRLQLPAEVHVFDTSAPETVCLDELGVALHGQGFETPAITDDLSARYPDPMSGMTNIGVLHTSCGSYEAHDRYAPSTIAGLTAKGYDYWALGHIHQRETLAGPHPWIVYPGNLQGRHIREDGAKGAMLVTVTDGHPSIDFRALDVVRWSRCDVDCQATETADDAVERVLEVVDDLLRESDGRPLGVRIRLSGRTNAHAELCRHPDHWDRRIREAVVDRFDEFVWVEKLRNRTEAVAASSAARELVSDLVDEEMAMAAFSEIRGDLEKVLSGLPTDPRLELDLDLENPDTVSQLLRQSFEFIATQVGHRDEA